MIILQEPTLDEVKQYLSINAGGSKTALSEVRKVKWDEYIIRLQQAVDKISTKEELEILLDNISTIEESKIITKKMIHLFFTSIATTQPL